MYDDLEGFARRVAELLEIEIDGSINPYDSLFDDWGIDSLQAFQLIVIIEAMAESLVPPAEMPEIYTVGDAHEYYRSLLPRVAG